MKNMLFNLSDKPDLQPLADVVLLRLEIGAATKIIAGLCEGLQQTLR